MWLSIQIAAGIVLAYVIIKNGAAVWRFSLGLVITVAVAAALLALGVFAEDAAADYGGIGAVFYKGVELVGMLLGAMLFIGCVFGEGYSIAIIVQNTIKRNWHSDNRYFFMGVANFFVAGLALQGFNIFDEGPIVRATNAFGRAHGLSDGITVFVWLIASLWPVPWAYWIKRKERNSDHAQGDNDD